MKWRKKMEKTNANDYLGKEVIVEIDRQLGTRHPKHGFMYMINYGWNYQIRKKKYC